MSAENKGNDVIAHSDLLSDSGFETAAGFFLNENRDVSMLSANGSASTGALFNGPGQSTSAKVGLTQKWINWKNEELYKDTIAKQGGDTKSTENSLSLGIDQGIRVDTTAGLTIGRTVGPIAKSSWIGMRFGEWWLEETLQTTLDIRSTNTTADPTDFTDIDNHRVRTPESIAGINVSIGFLNFATPSTILKGSVSRSTSNDRPPAQGAAAEVRQFIDATQSAIHFALSHYENVGKIGQETTFGSIVSNSARMEWHQRVFENSILMAGYRYYLENENPRAEGADIKQLGTDEIYSSYRWRFLKGTWTAEASEVYFFVGRYSTSEPLVTKFFGFGTLVEL